MNEHKFYNEYIKPVLEEVKEELKKRGVDTFIDGNELLIGGGGKCMSILTYNYAFAEFNVHEDYHNFFENEFNAVNCTTELVFKELEPPKEKSIYDLEIGDEFYYIGHLWEIHKFTIHDEGDIHRYRKFISVGNAFLTKRECRESIAKDMAIAKIKERTHELQGDWKPDWNNIDEQKYYIKYDHMDNQLMITSFLSIKHIGICFKSQHIATQITRELHKECKLMLEVDECTKN